MVGMGTSMNTKALQYVYDTLERMQCLSSYVLLGETSLAVRENRPLTGPIEVGLPQASVTPEVDDWLHEFGFTKTEKGYEASFENVPIIIKVIKRKYAFFKNPDTKFYDYDDYKLPNPFDKYWKARHIVQ